MRRFVFSPLVHFFALAALIFAVHAALDGGGAAPTGKTIRMTAAEADRLVQTFTATWKRPPTISELDALMRNWVRVEVNVREARALGLDRDDVVIRQRLTQKMRFLAETGAATLVPDEAALQAYLDRNAARFLTPARIAFAQVLLPVDQDAAPVQALLGGGADPAPLGAASLLPSRLPATPGPVIDRTFGTGFHAALLSFPVGQWRGPVESSYGQHLVRIESRTEAALPPLPDIRERVEAEWRAAEMETLRDSLERTLLSRYRVSLPDAATVLGQ